MTIKAETKTETWNSRKSWVKNMGIIVGACWWTRRHENVAFGTAIFRLRCLATSIRPENLHIWVITSIYHAKMMKHDANGVRIFDLTENMVIKFSICLISDRKYCCSSVGTRRGLKIWVQAFRGLEISNFLSVRPNSFQKCLFFGFFGTFPPHLHQTVHLISHCHIIILSLKDLT